MVPFERQREAPVDGESEWIGYRTCQSRWIARRVA